MKYSFFACASFVPVEDRPSADEALINKRRRDPAWNADFDTCSKVTGWDSYECRIIGGKLPKNPKVNGSAKARIERFEIA